MEAAVNAHNLGCKIVPWVDKVELAGERGCVIAIMDGVANDGRA